MSAVPANPYDLSPRQAATYLGIHEDTLKGWAVEGKVNAWKTPGGWWRFRKSDLDALLPEEDPNGEPVAS